ncbi:Plasmodium exported protein (PHISTa), unknown, putative [Plasmodium sp. gorilla clade G3]|nr:Plasmodium exported protein (PHISTa), unknown, putative [Plasmodium sp. gorilla clade G3]
MNKKKCRIFPWYSSDENHKRILHYISFKFLCLSLYMIGLYYVFLTNLYEYNSLEQIKGCNDCLRNLSEVKTPKEKKLKKGFFKNEKKSKNENKVNNKDTNKQNSDESKSCCSGNSAFNQMENENKDPTNYINYNDMSMQLTKEQLYDVLNSLTKVPPKENLIHLWSQTLGVNKEGLDVLLKDLLTYIPENTINDRINVVKYKESPDPYARMWFNFMGEFGRATLNENDFTRTFYDLIKGKPSIDDIRNYIFSFLEEFQHEYNEIYEKCKKDVISFMKKKI